MTNKSPPQEPTNSSKPHTPQDNLVLLCAVGLIGLLPVQAYFQAFTHSTPMWLQYLIIGMLTLGGLYAAIDAVIGKYCETIGERIYYLITALIFIGTLYGLWHSSNRSFLSVMGDSCFVFFMLFKAGGWFFKRTAAQPVQ